MGGQRVGIDRSGRAESWDRQECGNRGGVGWEKERVGIDEWGRRGRVGDQRRSGVGGVESGDRYRRRGGVRGRE